MIELGFFARYLGEKRRTFEYLALKMMMEKKKEEEEEKIQRLVSRKGERWREGQRLSPPLKSSL